MTTYPGPADPPGEDKATVVSPEEAGPAAKDEVSLSAETPLETPIPPPTAQKRTLSEAYGERLRLVWAAAHDTVTADEQEWELFRSTMLAVAEADASITDELPASSESGQPLEGDIDTVDLLVANEVRRQSDPQALVAFLRGTMAATLLRLERIGEGTPERRVDIVWRPLVPLGGAPGAADLSRDLLRYLQTQQERGPGFYATATALATALQASSDDRQEEATFAYHLTLEGMRSMIAVDGRESLDAMGAAAISQSANGAASILADLLQQRHASSTPDALRDLKAISVATLSPVSIRQDEIELVTALGFQTERAGDLLTVLLDMGSVAGAWRESPIGLARLEASSAVVEAALVSPGRPAARLFNAGVSLLRSAERDSLSVARGRLVVNALGLRLALASPYDVVTALSRLAGLSCAVNLVNAFADSRPLADATSEPMESLVRQLVSLTAWPPLQAAGPDVDVNLARLAASGERLGLVAEERASFPELADVLEAAIESLREHTSGPRRHPEEDLVLDSAMLIGHVFADVLPRDDESPSLDEIIAEAVRSRDYPSRVLVEHYAAYSAAPDQGVGPGPLVGAGLVDLATWERLAAVLLRPLDTIVPSLRALRLEG